MNDKTLLKVALIGAIIGIGMLFMLTTGEQDIIARIEHQPEGKEVKVTGVLVNVRDNGNVAFLTLAEQTIEETPVVLFKRGNISLQEHDIVTVTGTVDDYKGKKQLIGMRIEKK